MKATFLLVVHNVRSDEMNAVESLVMTQLTAMNSVQQPSLERVNACKKVGQTYGDFTDRGECCVGGFCVQSPVNNGEATTPTKDLICSPDGLCNWRINSSPLVVTEIIFHHLARLAHTYERQIVSQLICHSCPSWCQTSCTQGYESKNVMVFDKENTMKQSHILVGSGCACDSDNEGRNSATANNLPDISQEQAA